MAQRFWLRQARTVALRWNFACWLSFFLPIGAALSVAAGCLLLVARRAGWNLQPIWLSLAVTFLGATLVALVRVRPRAYSCQDGLVRLEIVLGLKNRLSAAAAGIASWPSPIPVKDGFGLEWARVGGASLLASAFLLFAMLIPLSLKTAANLPGQIPPAWSQVSEWLEKMREPEVVKPEALAAFQQKLDALRDQPAEEWYRHHSLEAGDSLRDDLAHSLREFEQASEKAERSLANAAKADAKPEALKQWSAALKGLENSALSLNPAAMQAMKELDPSKLKELDPAKIAKLKKALAESAGACKKCLGDGVGEYAMDKQLAAFARESNEGPPGGGPDGGGEAALTQKEAPTRLGTQTREAVSGEDMSRATLGDKVALSEGAHEVDPSKFGSKGTGGAITSPGAGGEAVWKNELTPDEREVLKRYFK